MKTQKELIAELMRREGKNRQVDVAQMSEIVGHLADIVHEELKKGVELNVVEMLDRLGERRLKASKK